MYFKDNESLRKSNKGIRLVLKTFIVKIRFYELIITIFNHSLFFHSGTNMHVIYPKS